jgi:hypothetical protein
MDTSKTDKYLLSGDKDGTVCLMNGELESLCEFSATPQENLKVGFNKRNESFFITTTPR